MLTSTPKASASCFNVSVLEGRPCSIFQIVVSLTPLTSASFLDVKPLKCFIFFRLSPTIIFLNSLTIVKTIDDVLTKVNTFLAKVKPILSKVKL